MGIVAQPGRGRRLEVVESSKASFQGVLAQGDEYDPNSFYVRSVDSHGHSAYVKERVDPDVDAQIRRLLASGQLAGTPMTTMGAVVRDALVHWVHKINKLIDDGYFAASAEDARRLARADMIVLEREHKQKILADAKNAFDGAARANDIQNTVDLLELYEPMVEGMRDPYRGELEGILREARAWLKRMRA